MKKLLFGTVAILSVSTVHGARAENVYDNDTSIGPYVGVYGGYGWTDADTNAGVSVSPDGGDYGIYGGVQVDQLLDSTVNRTGLGLTGAVELHYGWSGADDNVGGVNFEKDNEFGVSFRPGLSFLNNNAVLDINPYGIIGYRRTEYEASVGGLSADDEYDGFELGIGTQLLAYEDVGVRLDYTHVWYGEENGFDPDEDNLRIGVGYHF